jgi:flagellar biosynthesis protein FlhF
MIIKKFIAPSTRDALAMLRAEMGEDAIILSTKRTSAGTEVLGASNKEPAVVGTVVGSVVSPVPTPIATQQNQAINPA